MHYLIALIIAIALGGLYFFGFSGSVNEKPFIVEKNKIEILSGFSLLNTGENAYVNYNYENLDPLTWETQIRQHIRMPFNLNELSWDYNENGTGKYFCLTGNTKRDLLYEAILKINVDYTNVYLNEDCGATTDFATIPDIATNPKISLTYYIN